jgi:hypothetical protein
MQYPPVYIIFAQACKYLPLEEETILINKLYKLNKFYGRPFLKILLKNFDIEVFKDNPIIPEDIWLYNYIKYEITSKTIPRTGLIAKYEKKVFLKNK